MHQQMQEAAGGSAASSSAEGSSASDSGEKKVIKAATSGTLAPYFYVNDDNELTGVDIDIVKEVFNRLPQYELKIEQADAPERCAERSVRHRSQQLWIYR